MRRFFVLLGLVVLVGIAMPAAAQQVITFESVQVQLWPEYDQPAMLVIYTIELAEGTALPAEVRVRIPAAAGEPNAVAVAVDDQLLTTPYTRETSGEWSEIVITTDSRVLHVEYYDPGLRFDGRSRAFDYTWPEGISVGELIVRVQVPPGSANMQFSAAMGTPLVSSDTLSYYTRSFGPVAENEGFDFSLSYSKSSDRLTVDTLAGEGSASRPWWVWLLVGLGVVLIGAGGWFYFNDTKKSAKKARSKYARKKGSASRKASVGKKAARFCHNCGSASQAGDKFCRECGEKLRV